MCIAVWLSLESIVETNSAEFAAEGKTPADEALEVRKQIQGRFHPLAEVVYRLCSKTMASDGANHP
jgi:hypothetical protein